MDLIGILEIIRIKISFQQKLIILSILLGNYTIKIHITDLNQITGWLVGWLVGFYGVSTFLGYLTPNSVYMYTPFTNEYLVAKIFYKQDFTCLHMINQF